MAETTATKNDFNVYIEELSTSWKRLVTGTLEDVGRFKNFLAKSGSNFLDLLKSPIIGGIKDFFVKSKDFLKKSWEGGKALFGLISQGKWGEIGKIWGAVKEEDPAAWLAGSVAAGLSAVVVGSVSQMALAASGLLTIGGNALGWVGAGITGILKSPAVTGFIGVGMGSWLNGFVKAAPKIYQFDWQVSNEAYQKGIDQAITNLYEPAGEFLGRASGAFIAARLTGSKPPRQQVDVTALAIMHELGDDEIREEIEDAATEFMHVGVRTFMGIGLTYLYTEARQMIKAGYNKLPPEMRKSFAKIPWFGKGKDGKQTNLDQVLSTWGNKGNESWSVKKEIGLEEKIDSVEDEKLKGFLEGFFDNFWDTFSDCVTYSSAFKGGY